MGKIEIPSIFRRKVQVHSGEAIITRVQMEKMRLRSEMSQDDRDMAYALKQLLDEIEDEGVEITDAELEQRINELCKAYGVTPPSLKPKKHKPHTCSQCGAPIHKGKCDYCGTEY